MQQKLENERAAEAAALDLELRKAHREIDVLDVAHADKPRIFHRLREAVAAVCVRRGAAVLRAGLAEVHAADGLVAALPVGAAEPAALVAQKFDLVLLRLREGGKCVKLPVQAKIRHDITEIRAIELAFELAEIGEHLGGRGHEVKTRPALRQILEQQVGVDDDAVLHAAALREQAAQRIAFPVGQVLLAEQGIAERQTRGDAVFLHEREHIARRSLSEPGAAAAPETVRRRAVDRADFAPAVEIFPVLAEQRQEYAVQLVELEQAGQMKICGIHSGHLTSESRSGARADGSGGPAG